MSDCHGSNVLVMVSRAMPMEINNIQMFPNIDGRDIAKEFEIARKPLVEMALKAH